MNSQPNLAYPRIGGIVLAAGLSRRFGAENKLLHPVCGIPMLTRVIDAFTGTGIGRLVVVLGHDADRVRRVLADRTVEIIVNERYIEGMGTSIAEGVASLIADDLDGVLVCVGDLPDLSCEDIRMVCRTFGQNDDHVVVPRFHGRRGHPVCFPRSAFKELAALGGDSGAREVIQRHAPPIFADEVSRGCVSDLDSL